MIACVAKSCRGGARTFLARAVALGLTLALGGGGAPAQTAAPSPPALVPTAAQPSQPPMEQKGERPAVASPPAPVAVETDPLALKAAQVLDTHCARCHQAGKLKGLVPAGGFGNVLRLGELAREPELVVPQVPDASRLYLSMVERRMPLDVYRDGNAGPEPTADEIQAVRDWITSLEPRRDACPGRDLIPPEKAMGAMRAALQRDPAAAATTRFVSLTHLYNACVPEAELGGYRQAAAKLLNSLAWSLEPARLEPVDPEQTILKLRLGDLGWVSPHWEQLARAFPSVTAPTLKPAEDLVSATGTKLPALPADWIAATALQPGHYYDLLGLPAELDDLKRILSLDTAATVKSGKAVRVAVETPKVTRVHRVIEMHPLVTGGMLWFAHDFTGTIDQRDVFQHPLGARGTPGVADPFRQDATRMMFNLPNGFLAYAVFDAEGHSIPMVPAGIDRPEVGGFGAGAAGSSCIACHVSGPVAVKDDLRRRLTAAGTPASKSLLDQLQTVMRSEGELDSVFDDEAYRFRRALIRAGVDPDLRIGGLEPVAALRRYFERAVSVTAAAAEYGLPEARFRTLLARLSGPMRDAAIRLQQGLLPRSEVGALFAALQGVDHAPTPPREVPPSAAASAGHTAVAPPRVELQVLTDRTSYKVGELATFRVRASGECRLTLTSVNKAGKAIVLFPNEFEQENAMQPGRELIVPGPNAPYQFRLKDPGIETLVAVCTQYGRIADGIQADYEKQRFTILGDWRNFLHTALEDEAAERANPDKGDKSENGRRRRNGGASTKKPAPNEALRSGKPDPQTRTAIQYRVE